MNKLEKLQRFFVEELQVPAEAVAPDHPIIANKILDSFGILQVVSFVEGEFGVAVEAEELVPENFGSIEAIVQLVDSKQAQHA